MKEFKFKPRISASETAFKKKLEKKEWNWFKQQMKQRYKYTCQGCGIALPNKPNLLEPHIFSGKPEDLEKYDDLNNIDTTLLCKVCHIVQHLDYAVEKDYVIFVNSYFSQKELIAKCRDGQQEIESLIKNNSIVLLKHLDVKKFLEELKDPYFAKTSRVKIIMSKNFDWSIAK